MLDVQDLHVREAGLGGVATHGVGADHGPDGGRSLLDHGHGQAVDRGAGVQEALHLDGDETAGSPIATALEWGVRQLERRLRLRTSSGVEKPVKVDLFPAYDEDGGLLVALTPD